MQKKIMNELVWCLVLMIAILCAGCAKKISKNITPDSQITPALTAGVLEEDPEYLYEKTVAEVTKINENSYFFGYKLLDAPPKGSVAGNPSPLNDDNFDDIFYTGRYHGACKIIAIGLVSENANLLGIAPGDELKVIPDKLDGTSFIQVESYFENKIRYEAYHIILEFEFGEDGSIDEIGISISDPTEVKPDY